MFVSEMFFIEQSFPLPIEVVLAVKCREILRVLDSHFEWRNPYNKSMTSPPSKLGREPVLIELIASDRKLRNKHRTEIYFDIISFIFGWYLSVFVSKRWVRVNGFLHQWCLQSYVMKWLLVMLILHTVTWLEAFRKFSTKITLPVAPISHCDCSFYLWH